MGFGVGQTLEECREGICGKSVSEVKINIDVTEKAWNESMVEEEDEKTLVQERC